MLPAQMFVAGSIYYKLCCCIMAFFKTHKVYVRVYVNRIYVRNVTSGKWLEGKPRESDEAVIRMLH